MACKKCGGGGAVTPISESAAADLRATGDMLLIEYIGPQEQKQRIRSKVQPQEHYVFGAGQKRFLAYRGDIDFLTSMANRFKLIEDELPVFTDAANVPVLTSEAKPFQMTDFPIDILTLDPITLALLKREYTTVNEVRNVGRAGWLVIKGIGATRADEIEEALRAIQK